MNAVIFDFDGTIANSFEHVLEFLLEHAGRSSTSVTPEERASLKGLAMKDLALRVGIPKWKLPWLYFRGKAYMTKRMHTMPPFPGMEGVLASLHGEGYQLYMLSSNSRFNIMRFMSEHGFGGYFRKVYGNAGWFGKGAPLKRALKQNRLEANKSIYVGDEVRDIVGAHDAGMASVAVSWGFGSEEQLLLQNPTILVRTPEQLQKALLDWAKTV